MDAKIVFLGTGGDAVVIGKGLLGCGGFVLKLGDIQFHIDPGPNSLVDAIKSKVNIRANTAVFSTVYDVLHFNDVNAVIAAMTYDGFDKKGVFVSTEEIVENVLLNKSKRNVERVIALNPEQRLGIEDVEIRTLPLNNKAYGFGLKFITDRFVLSYSSDTEYSRSVAKSYEDSDILILNVQQPGDEKAEGMLCRKDAEKIISIVKPKLAIITHFGLKMWKADPIYEARELQRATGCQVIAARDGLAISPLSYSARSKQRRLMF